MRTLSLLLAVAVLGCSSEPSAVLPSPASAAPERQAQSGTIGPQQRPESDDDIRGMIGARRGNDFSYKYPRPQRPGDPVEDPTLRPVLIHRVDPEYTEQAKTARVAGIVVLQIVIESDGRVSGGRVLKHLPMGLTQKAIDAVEQWKYEPAVHEGLPVRTREVVSVAFNPSNT